MKSSQSIFNLRSPSSYLARSYLIATVSIETDDVIISIQNNSFKTKLGVVLGLLSTNVCTKVTQNVVCKSKWNFIKALDHCANTRNHKSLQGRLNGTRHPSHYEIFPLFIALPTKPCTCLIYK